MPQSIRHHLAGRLCSRTVFIARFHESSRSSRSVNNLSVLSDKPSVSARCVAKTTDRVGYFHARHFFHQRASPAFGLQPTRVCYMFMREPIRKTTRMPEACSSMCQWFWFRFTMHTHTMIVCANNRAHVIAINRVDRMVAAGYLNRGDAMNHFSSIYTAKPSLQMQSIRPPIKTAARRQPFK